MKCLIYPPGQIVGQAVELTAEPTYSRAEQGGYKDASIPCIVPSALKGHLRESVVELQGDGHYWGFATSYDGEVLSARGYQDYLSWDRRGVIFRAEGGSHWNERGWASSPGKAEVVNGSLVVTFPAGMDRAEGLPVCVALDFPQPVATAHLNATYSIPSTAQLTATVSIMNRLRYEDAGFTLGSYTSTSGSISLDVGHVEGEVTSVLIYVDPSFVGDTLKTTTSHEVVISNIALYGTTVTNTTVAAVVGNILSTAGLSYYEVTASGTVYDLRFGPSSSAQDKIEELLKYGDYQAFYTSRIINNQSTPYFVFRSAPTTPLYSLREDANTVFDIKEESSDGLYSFVRALYTDELGRERFTDYGYNPTDTDYLAHIGRVRYINLPVNTTSVATASAAAGAFRAKVAADKARGTISIKGPTAGLNPGQFDPGELVMLYPKTGGELLARISEINYTGDVSCALTLDDTVTVDALLARLSSMEATSGNRIY